MSQITRGKDLHHVGLAENDLEERVIVAVGWMENELLPPYRDCREIDVQRVMAYLEGKQYRRARSSLHPEDIRRRFRQIPKLVEIVGALAHGCVRVTAHYFVEMGASVYIDPEQILPGKRHPYPPYWVGRIFLQQMLSRQPERRCLVRDGAFIIYNRQ